jgi:hypothetical protein
MSGTVVGAVGTFALSLVLAYGLLRLRCRKVGPPFGRHARYWSFSIVVATAVVSTGAGLLIVSASHHGHDVFVGIVVPCGLGLRKFPPQRDRDLLPRTLSGLLTLPFSQVYERIGDDMQDWCDIRVKAASPQPRWISDAVTYYHRQVVGRLKDAHALADLDGWQASITHKIKIVRMINVEADRDQLRVALQMHASTRHIRGYTEEDLARLARRLETESLNELHLYLAYAYRNGHHKMLIYPFRPSAQRFPVQSA